MAAVFPTVRKENFFSLKYKLWFNFFPAFRASGGKVIFASSDWCEVHLMFKLCRKTRNYHGTGFGGAIYSSLDPIYPMQFIFILGPEYVIWDKSATIEYIRPIDKNVYAKFELNDEIIQFIKEEVAKNGRYFITLPVEYRDLDGNVYARATKTVYIGSKAHYDKRKLEKEAIKNNK